MVDFSGVGEVKYPDKWPRRRCDLFAHQTRPECNMLIGPCECGLWHTLEQFTDEMLAQVDGELLESVFKEVPVDRLQQAEDGQSAYDRWREAIEGNPNAERLDILLFYGGHSVSFAPARARGEGLCDCTDCYNYAYFRIMGQEDSVPVEAGRFCNFHYELFNEASGEVG